jgi:flagellar hook-associated protein 2
MDILSALNKNGSGINLKDLTSTLVAAEIEPVRATINARKTTTEASISALGQVRSGLDRLGSAISVLQSTPVLGAEITGNGAEVTFTDRSKLTEGTTELNVLNLASRQVLEFRGFASMDTVVGGGTLTVDTGVWVDPANGSFVADPQKQSQTLTLGANATLSQIAEALNALDGVSARVLDKGDGTFSLGIASELGAGSGLRFTVTPDGPDSTLAALDTQAGVSAVQIQAASDALLEVDGIAVLRPSNAIDDLLPGARIDLTRVGTTSITVARDRDTASTNMEFMVASLNETLGLLGSLTTRGGGGGVRGTLAGDLAAQDLQEQIRALVATPIQGHGDNEIFLTDLGIATQRDGSFRFDTALFERAFDADPTRFDAIFTDTLRSQTEGISISGKPSGDKDFGVFAFARPAGSLFATVDGSAAIGESLGDGTTRYVPLRGALAGTEIIATDGITSGSLQFGKSFLTLLQDKLDDVLSRTGQISAREKVLADTMVEDDDALAALESKSAMLENRYLSRFTAMEVAISQLKSTGTYLTNLVDAWNKKD